MMDIVATSTIIYGYSSVYNKLMTGMMIFCLTRTCVSGLLISVAIKLTSLLVNNLTNCGVLVGGVVMSFFITRYFDYLSFRA